MQRQRASITTAIAIALAATPLAAASAATDRIDITTWDQAELYDGWTAEQLFDTEVRGSENDELGEIENLVIGADGRVTKIIVESGGFLDIGDTHFAVPWDQVEFGPDMAWVRIPVDEDNVEEFGLFGDDQEPTTGPRAWRASELINDYVRLQDGVGYGIVQDIVFSQDGDVEAVVVYPDVGYGTGRPYAYPYYGYDREFDPGAETYELPYVERDRRPGAVRLQRVRGHRAGQNRAAGHRSGLTLASSGASSGRAAVLMSTDRRLSRPRRAGPGPSLRYIAGLAQLAPAPS